MILTSPPPTGATYARERVKIGALNGRSFKVTPMAKTGDNEKVLLTGEYTTEVHHENAMARLR